MKKRLALLLTALVLLSLSLPAVADEEKPAATPGASGEKNGQSAVRVHGKPKQEKSLEYWEEVELPGLALTGRLREDVLIIARSQLDYSADKSCYVLTDSGRKRYYTRYGAWDGATYGDWCDSFVSFCVHYAGNTSYPREASCARHMFQLKADGYWREWNSYIPRPGDLVFFKINKGTLAPDHVGLVEQVIPGVGNEGGKLITIEGNMRNPNGGTSCVRRVTRSLDDVVGYGTYDRGKTYPEGYTVRSNGRDIIGEDSVYFIDVPREGVLRFLGLYDSRYYRYWFPESSSRAAIVPELPGEPIPLSGGRG